MKKKSESYTFDSSQASYWGCDGQIKANCKIGT